MTLIDEITNINDFKSLAFDNQKGWYIDFNKNRSYDDNEDLKTLTDNMNSIETNRVQPYNYALTLDEDLYDDNKNGVFKDYPEYVTPYGQKYIIMTVSEINKLKDSDDIEGMYYSTTKDTWDKAKTSTWDEQSSELTMTVDHF